MNSIRKILFRFAAFCILPGISLSAHAQNYKVNSPDGLLRCKIFVAPSGHLSYEIYKGNAAVVLPSPIGISVNGDDLGERVSTGKARKNSTYETYATRGTHSLAVNRYNESVIPVKGGSSQTEWFLDVRVFPDAVAYRYRVPGHGTRRIDGEASAWQLRDGTTLWYQTTRKKDYEMPYAVMKPDTVTGPLDILTSSLFILPDESGFVMLGEANLTGCYSDMALTTEGKGLFKSLFHNSLDGWQTDGDIISPWRVVIAVDSLDQLVNTDVFHNLCPPAQSDIAGASWIKPGKSTWAWMVTGAPQFEQQRKWVDMTSELGLEYYLVDDGWKKWEDGDRDQWEMMKELTDYAASRGVGIWAWVRATEVRTRQQQRDYAAKARAAGLVGLKIDFMGAANPEWVMWYDDVLETTVQEQLMVIFHGANKPTGRDRTWPHDMTREAIRGREMGKQPATHDIALPFSRFVLGCADYTPTDFRPERLKGSTWAHELAMPVVFTSSLMVLSGNPSDYIESEARGIIAAMPPVWDQTVVLPGSIPGEIAAFARRSGDEWYVGVLNGSPREFEFETSFLEDGSYSVEEFSDIDGQTAAWNHRTYVMKGGDRVRVRLNRDGGYVARLKKL